VIDSVVVWKWRTPGYRSKFDASAVNILRNQVARHYPDPHRFICVTDDSAGIDAGIETYPLGDLYLDLKNPTWSWGPNCYPRLQAFAPEFEQVAGRRFVSMDLDTVITGDLRPLWNRPEDFVIYASERARMAYNGSMFMMNAGARREVFDKFDPLQSPAIANAAGFKGSDQGWIGYCLGKGEANWSGRDGVMAYRYDCLQMRRGGLHPRARVVVFHGKYDPWQPETQRMSPWIRNHYR
jgi:hypothetical protein